MVKFYYLEVYEVIVQFLLAGAAVEILPASVQQSARQSDSE